MASLFRIRIKRIVLMVSLAKTSTKSDDSPNPDEFHYFRLIVSLLQVDVEHISTGCNALPCQAAQELGALLFDPISCPLADRFGGTWPQHFSDLSIPCGYVVGNGKHEYLLPC
jgi:hypothetical protein